MGVGFGLSRPITMATFYSKKRFPLNRSTGSEMIDARNYSAWCQGGYPG